MIYRISITMDLETLKRIIEDQRYELKIKFKKENMIERDNSAKFQKHLKTPFVFAISGARRCGKSIFSILMVRDKKYGYVNFDDDRLYGIELHDLDEVRKAIYYIYGDVDHLVLDEIQNIPGWELFVNKMARSKGLILTGSNATLESKELSAHLGRRYMDFKLHPFSFREYLGLNGFEPNLDLASSISRTKKYLDEYIKIGGLPDAYKFGERFLLSLYNDILSRDILSRHNIRYQRAFFDIARYLLSNYSNEFSYNSLSKMGRVRNVHTIKNYVSHLKNSYLVFEIQRFSYKLKEQKLAPRKMYCVDTGLIHAVGLETSKDMGRLMENMVAVALQRRRAVDPKISIYYWKDHQKREVDFIVMRGNKIMECIQVSHALEANDIEKKKLRSLLRASRELGCKNRLVITWDYEEDGDDVRYVPLWKWLL